jgi:hypothetical protein
VKVAGWVGADEFDVVFLVLLLTVTKVVTLGKDGRDDGGKGFFLEEEIDESRASDFDMIDKVARDTGFNLFG